jgi:hypothetical protein
MMIILTVCWPMSNQSQDQLVQEFLNTDFTPLLQMNKNRQIKEDAQIEQQQ